MQKRRWHYVKVNENNETLHQCIFVDTETDEIPMDKGYTGHKLRFGWAVATRRTPRGDWTSGKWKRFTDPTEFWLWTMSFTRSGCKTWIWCHNASFDLPVLNTFSHLPDIGWSLESAIIDAPPTVIKYRSSRKTLMLCDTLNIWRMSLEKLGRKVGLAKLAMPETWTGKDSDDEYCRRDVEIIRKAVCEWSDFLQAQDLGGFAPTIAAQSMRTYRHRYMDQRILIDCNGIALELARACYHGGRCEAHYIGRKQEPVHYFDVNSMYPYVMSYAEMPLRLRGVCRYTQLYQLRRLVQEYAVCAHVRLYTDTPAFPVVLDGKLCFPVGRFDAYLVTPEIKYALENGWIEEIHLCATYEKGVVFRDFAIDLYSHKENAARAGRLSEAEQWKLLLNSFYGKWGQSGRKWIKTGTCDPNLFRRGIEIDAQTLEQTARRDFGGITQICAQNGESLESHPAIAAHITGHARMVLWTLIEKVSPKDYLYCDTDALLVLDAGADALSDRVDQFGLGGLKKVKTYHDVTIYGCKDYVLDGKEVTKGIRNQAERLDKGKYRQLKWHSLKGLLSLGSLDMPLTIPIDKFLNRKYTKGIVGPDGYVSPLHLGVTP